MKSREYDDLVRKVDEKTREKRRFIMTTLSDEFPPDRFKKSSNSKTISYKTDRETAGWPSG